MKVGAALFGHLYRASRAEALRQIAEAGYELVELTATPPFVDLSEVGRPERLRIKQELKSYQLSCVSVNPVELNPISVNRDLSEACHRQYRAALELASELEAQSVVMITGRRSPLIPGPESELRDLLSGQLDRLVGVAERLGVSLTLEPVPYGFLQTAAEVAAYIQETRSGDLGITFDCANSFFAGADLAAEVRAAGELVKLVHISDSWSGALGARSSRNRRDRFRGARARLGRGLLSWANHLRARRRE